MSDYQKKGLIFFSISLLAIVGQDLLAQVTSIPDPNFEQALIDLGIDSDSTVNGKVTSADINSVKDLDISSYQIEDLNGIQDFDSLENLNFSNNRLETVNLTKNTFLIDLNTAGNQLTSLDLSSNNLIETLNVTGNQLGNLLVNSLDSLRSLRCSNNRLIQLNLSRNLQLLELFCDSNQLTNLDVTDNEYLTALIAGSNQLAALDLTKNDSLTLINCSDNQLTTLDISQNRKLENLTLSSNQLSSLTLNRNDSLVLLDCSSNNLNILELSQNKKLESLSIAFNQLTTIEIDSNLHLKSLDFSYNLVQAVNLREHDSLTYLDVSSNQLEYLNLQNGHNEDLGFFNAQSNPKLTCILIDDINQVGDSWLKDTRAAYSNFCDPILTYIPDSNFEQTLIDLGFDSGSPDSLVVRDSIRFLLSLDVSGRGIVDLTGIEDFQYLTDLNCSNNQLVSLDFTRNKALTDLNCSSNLLTGLLIKNGNNNNLSLFDARNNPGLTCITVDDQTQIGSNWMKDGAASYADNCNSGQTFIPDDNFEQALIALGLDSVLDNYVATDSVLDLVSLDVGERNISDLSGIEAFAELDYLDCSDNNLTTLDLSQNLSLKKLVAFGNYLSTIDVGGNDSLVSFNVGNNQLSTLDVSNNMALVELIFDANNLKSVDISNNPLLIHLNGNSNHLTGQGLDLSTLPQLQQLLVANNSLTDIDISNNSRLKKLDVSNNYLIDLDLQSNDSLEVLECSINQLSVLDVNNNLRLDTLKANTNRFTNLSFTPNLLLRYLSLENNLITVLDISSSVLLGTLFISSNQLDTLDLTNSAGLNFLHCDNNQLESLDVTNNLFLVDLSVVDNQLEVLDISQNPELLNLNCSGNSFTALDLSLNLNLSVLSIARNQFDSINTSFNPALTNLVCDDNNIGALNLSANTQLASLSCNSNNINDLDLSSHSDLRSLNISSNQLNTLIVKNGSNDSLSVLNTVNNPDLFCIEIDNVNLVQDSWQKDSHTSYNEFCHYEDTYIPDDNFEAKVAVITGVADDNDDYIPTSVIANLQVLDVNSSNISDLTGIQDFDALEELNISDNNIDHLDLDSNLNLKQIYVSGNNLDTLILILNQLEVLDVSSNQLTLFSTDSLTSLVELIANDNQLTKLDVRENGLLEILNCAANNLLQLKVDNGNNANLQLFDATGNVDLTCIQVDDPDNIGAGWSKGAQASYSDNCHFNETYVPDDAFEQALIDQGFDYSRMEVPDDYIPTDKINTLTSLTISNRGIVDLTGLEAFDSLTSLSCRGNQILDLRTVYGLNLSSIDCSNNQIAEFDFSALPGLKTLNIADNQLTSVDISVNPELTSLNFSSNQLTLLDISQNFQLVSVNASSNKLFAINANNGNNDSLKTFVVNDNAELRCILVDDTVAVNSRSGWIKDASAAYRLECDDDDGDGVPDDEDQCPLTPFGDEVDLFGCSVFQLPIDNFNIQTTGETCSEADNGKIKIVAKQSILYTVTLTGGFEPKIHQFTDTLEIRNLKAEDYQLCITIEDHPSYEQCYELPITEPEDLIVKSDGIIGGRISYEMLGGEGYIVSFNGLIFETEENHLTLTLNEGVNHIKIKTRADCQGTFEQELFLSEQVRLFPNPFTDQLKFNLGNTPTESIHINIHSMTGQTVYSNRVPVRNGQVVINTSSFSDGVYSIGLIENDRRVILKALKR